MASSIKISRSLGYGMPDASQSFGYMLIDVKPGIVFTSQIYISNRSRVTRKSTRAMPEQSIALNAFTAMSWTLFVILAGITAGMMI
jgi:hypothetical protein